MGTKTILEYDFTGKYIRTIKQDLPSTRFLVYDKDKLLFQMVDPSASNMAIIDNILIVTDINGNKLLNFKNLHKRTSEQGIMIEDYPMYYYGTDIRFIQSGVDTLFTIKNEGLEPFAVINLGGNKMDPDPSIPFQNADREKVLNQLKE